MPPVLKRTFTLGRYHCVERLGSGPLHETWRAKLYGIAGLERQVLVKRVHAHLLSDPGLVQRLNEAVRVYLGLGLHKEAPGVLRLREVEHRGQQYYLVLDFAGADLSRLFGAFQRYLPPEARGALPGVVATIGAQVAATLAALHAQGVLHGGLSPQAVCLDKTGQALITDVALLSARKAGDWLAEAEVAPLLPYLAPEVLRGEAADASSEVYSLAVVLHEALHGELPAAGEGAGNQDQEWEQVAGENGALSQVLSRALSARPAARHGSMGEFCAALSAIAAREEAQAVGLLLMLGRRMQRSERPEPSSVSDPGADPLPPPPSRAEEGRGFVPPGLPVLVPSRSSDPMRDAPHFLRANRSGPVAVSMGHRSGPVAVVAGQRRAEARVGAVSQRLGTETKEPGGAEAKPGVQGRTDAALASTASRIMDRGAPRVVSPFSRPGNARPSSAFLGDEEDSTVPVPHSPKSKIVTMDADPPGGGGTASGQARVFGILPEETPLPISIPMLGSDPGPGPGPGMDLTDVPAAPGMELPRWSTSSFDSGPTAMAEIRERATPGQGSRTPLARVFPGRHPAATPMPAVGNGVVQDNSDRVTGEHLAEGLERRLGDPAGEPSGRASRRVAPRPAGFTDFDEPTALADYTDSALAGLVSLSSRDKSGPVVGNPSREVGSSPPRMSSSIDLGARGASRSMLPGISPFADPTEARRFSLADAYAPLITAPVPLSTVDDLEISISGGVEAEDDPVPEAKPNGLSPGDAGLPSAGAWVPGGSVPTGARSSPGMSGARSSPGMSGARSSPGMSRARSSPGSPGERPQEIPAWALAVVAREAASASAAARASTGTPMAPAPSESFRRPSMAEGLGDSVVESPAGSWPLPAPALSESDIRPRSIAERRRGTAAIVLASFLGSLALGVCVPLFYRSVRRGPAPDPRTSLHRETGPGRRNPEPEAGPGRPGVMTARSPERPADSPGEKAASPGKVAASPGKVALRGETSVKGLGGNKLLLSSIPTAAIFVDGKPIGHTPATLVLSGTHRLVLVAEKRKIWQQAVEPGAPLSVTLEPVRLVPPIAGKAGLKVRCASKGKLRLLVDGTDTGVSCPSNRISLSPGTHQIGFLQPATGEKHVHTVVVKDINRSVRLYTKY